MPTEEAAAAAAAAQHGVYVTFEGPHKSIAELVTWQMRAIPLEPPPAPAPAPPAPPAQSGVYAVQPAPAPPLCKGKPQAGRRQPSIVNSISTRKQFSKCASKASDKWHPPLLSLPSPTLLYLT